MWVMRVVMTAFAVGALLFIAIGATIAAMEAHKLKTYQPVQAQVLSTKIERVHDSDGDTQRPLVVYRYTVNGRAYESHSVTTTNESSSGSWARQTIQQFPEGTTVTAWYDPADPSSAFLIHEASIFPYIFILFPMVHLSVALGFTVDARMTRWPKAKPPVCESRGWFELSPYRVTWQKLRPWLVVAGVWYAVGAGALGHYYSYAHAPYSLLTKIVTFAYLGVGTVPLVMCAYFLLLCYVSFDATMLVAANTFALGNSLRVRLIYPVRRDGTLEKLEIGLICDRHVVQKTSEGTSYHTEKAFEDWQAVIRDKSIRPGEVLDFARDVVIPSRGSPTSNNEYPRYVWKLACRATLVHAPDYKAEFIIDVKPAGQLSPVAISAQESTL